MLYQSFTSDDQALILITPGSEFRETVSFEFPIDGYKSSKCKANVTVEVTDHRLDSDQIHVALITINRESELSKYLNKPVTEYISVGCRGDSFIIDYEIILLCEKTDGEFHFQMKSVSADNGSCYGPYVGEDATNMNFDLSTVGKDVLISHDQERIIGAMKKLIDYNLENYNPIEQLKQL